MRDLRPDPLDLNSLADHFREMFVVIISLDGLVVMMAMVFTAISALIAFLPFGFATPCIVIISALLALYVLRKRINKLRALVKIVGFCTLFLVIVSAFYIRIIF